MAYPFRDSATAFCSQIQPIRDLARTDDPFDPEFAGRLPSGRAYAFDSIKDRVCNYRSPNAKQKLRSADALLIGERDSELWYYFVDFKNQKADNIQSARAIFQRCCAGKSRARFKKRRAAIAKLTKEIRSRIQVAEECDWKVPYTRASKGEIMEDPNMRAMSWMSLHGILFTVSDSPNWVFARRLRLAQSAMRLGSKTVGIRNLP